MAFLEAMIDLKQKDPIEFQLKMSQFEANSSQQKNIEQDDNQVKCPYCKSTDVKKITGAFKVGSAAL